MIQAFPETATIPVKQLKVTAEQTVLQCKTVCEEENPCLGEVNVKTRSVLLVISECKQARPNN